MDGFFCTISPSPQSLQQGECIRALWQFGWQGEMKGVILSTSNTMVQLGGWKHTPARKLKRQESVGLFGVSYERHCCTVRPTPLKAFFTPFSVAVVILTLGRFVWVCESSHCDLADRPLGTTFLSKPWSFICIQSMSYHRDKNTEDYGLNKLWTIT